MAAVPCPVLPPAVSGQLCLSFVQLWAAPSRTIHGSSARGWLTGTGVMPMDTVTPCAEGSVQHEPAESGGESARLPVHRPKLGKAFSFNISASVS